MMVVLGVSRHQLEAIFLNKRVYLIPHPSMHSVDYESLVSLDSMGSKSDCFRSASGRIKEVCSQRDPEEGERITGNVPDLIQKFKHLTWNVFS